VRLQGSDIYTGSITRTGVGPDFTGFLLERGKDKGQVTIKMENGLDAMRLSGV
jgi:hypothetical protein